MPNPFDAYPGNGRTLLGKKSDGNCRHGYGLTLMRLTGQTTCGYCQMSLVDSYEQWLLMSVDHVLPHSACRELNIPEIWWHDYSNLILSCAGCNGFKNRWKLDVGDPPKPWTLDQFYDLRDAAYLARLPLIEMARQTEKAFFASQPWRKPLELKRRPTMQSFQDFLRGKAQGTSLEAHVAQIATDPGEHPNVTLGRLFASMHSAVDQATAGETVTPQAAESLRRQVEVIEAVILATRDYLALDGHTQVERDEFETTVRGLQPAIAAVQARLSGDGP
jgi:5-methylcytosine-specific restriction endonuclease McrA